MCGAPIGWYRIQAGSVFHHSPGLGEDIVVESLAAGKTVVIDAKTGLVTIDGANAFDKVDLWEFPVLKAGETALTFSNTKARVTVRYTPMWI